MAGIVGYGVYIPSYRIKVEEIAKSETKTSVGTVGFIENRPNSMNVVPGHTKFTVDLRDIHNDSMDIMMEKTFDEIKKICDKRKIQYKSLDTKIASVTKKGKVVGKKKGKTKIRVSCNGLVRYCKVTVK